ncbi:MAG: hypothetical protein GY863_10055 [bacterium]|nr:hypothetical protein [bacterium]
MLECPRCNSNRLIEGKLDASGRLIFIYSLKERKVVSQTPLAITCEDCGHMQFNYNPESLTICFSKNDYIETELQ